jgi:hypothetical protein
MNEIKYVTNKIKSGSGTHTEKKNLSTQTHPSKLVDAKVEFIKANFPEIEKINPYLDYAFINKVKKAMTEAGHYKQSYYQADGGINSAVINLINKAKGEKQINHRPSKR